MQRHGWTLLFHPCLTGQLEKLKVAAERAEAADPAGFAANANVKLYRALSHLIFDIVPSDPGREEYRLGNTMGRSAAIGFSWTHVLLLLLTLTLTFIRATSYYLTALRPGCFMGGYAIKSA